jgi:hypothetical protein
MRQAVRLVLALVGGLDTDFEFGQAAALAGCPTVVFEFSLPPDEITELDLRTIGIPADAEILFFNLTSRGNTLPTVLHTNDVHRYLYDGVIRILGRGIRDVTRRKNSTP